MESRNDACLFAFWHQAVLMEKAGQILADVGAAPLFVWVPDIGSLVIDVEIQAALDSLNNTEQFILAKLVWCFHVSAHRRECVPSASKAKRDPFICLASSLARSARAGSISTCLRSNNGNRHSVGSRRNSERESRTPVF